MKYCAFVRAGVLRCATRQRSAELNHDDPSSFSPPAAFGPFRVLHQIGSGVLGPVFRTYEPERDRLIAVKAFRIDLLPEQAALLAAELQRITDTGLSHPGIVQPLAAGMEGHLPYLAQEYVAAESLDIAMKHYAPAAPGRVMPFLRGLAGAIDAAAAAGIFHGALHPRDVFVTTDEARATGFGIVQAIENIGFRAPTRRPYTAPERVEADEWGLAADVFSLGAISHELLTGRRPAGPGDQDGSFSADVPAEHRARLREVLATALAEDPAARFTSATAFVDALEAAAQGQRPDLPAPPMTREAPAAASAAAAVGGAAAMAATPSLFDADDEPPEAEEDEDEPEADEPVETVAEVEDTTDVEDATGIEDTSSIEDTGDVQDPLDIWPPKGFATDDLDVIAERETDEALSDFDLDLNVVEPVAATDVEPDEPALDYEIGAESDEDEFHDEASEAGEDDDEIAAMPAVAAVPTVAAARPEEWRPASPTVVPPPAPPAQSNARLALSMAGCLALGLLIGWVLWARDAAPAVPADDVAESTQQPAAPAPSAAGPSETSPPAPVTEEPVAPAAQAPSTPAPAATQPAPANGSLLVRSTPANAMVVIDGVWTGRTPLTKRGMSFGNHTVRVVLEGYVPVNVNITISPDNATREMTFELARTRATRTPVPQQQPAPRGGTPETAAAPVPGARATSAAGSLSVNSRPAGARVLVDGQPVGVTPLNLVGVRAGSHHVRIELQDYRPWSTTIEVRSGAQARVSASLEQR